MTTSDQKSDLIRPSNELDYYYCDDDSVVVELITKRMAS